MESHASLKIAEKVGHCMKGRGGVISRFNEFLAEADAVSHRNIVVVIKRYPRKRNVNCVAV